MPDTQELYDRDFYLWTREIAAALREGRLGDIDVEHVAEEIEDLGNNNRRELESRVTRILEHLLKLRLSKATILDNNKRGWNGSIRRQRVELERLLRQSPSLRRFYGQSFIDECYRAAAGIVADEYGVEPPAECPFGPEDVL